MLCISSTLSYLFNLTSSFVYSKSIVSPLNYMVVCITICYQVFILHFNRRGCSVTMKFHLRNVPIFFNAWICLKKLHKCYFKWCIVLPGLLLSSVVTKFKKVYSSESFKSASCAARSLPLSSLLGHTSSEFRINCFVLLGSFSQI